MSTRASSSFVGMGDSCGQTAEKRSANRVLRQVDGVTGGMYLDEVGFRGWWIEGRFGVVRDFWYVHNTCTCVWVV